MNDAPTLQLDVDLFAGLYEHQVTELEYDLSTTSNRLLYWEQGCGTPAATRTRLIDDFDSGKLPVLLLQSQSGSLGLNLQSCRYAAIVEPDWTSAITEQAIARLYRAGQVRDVTIDFLLIPNSLDEHVVTVARRKATLAAELIETPLKEAV